MESAKVDIACKATTASFKGFLEFEDHKKLGNAVLDLAIKNGYSKMIIDTSELKVIRQDTQKWIETDWFPRANSSGIKYMAFIVPTDVLGKMSTTRVNEKSGNIEIQHVDSMAKAKTWLISKI
jgi:hypothetical protein